MPSAGDNIYYDFRHPTGGAGYFEVCYGVSAADRLRVTDAGTVQVFNTLRRAGTFTLRNTSAGDVAEFQRSGSTVFKVTWAGGALGWEGAAACSIVFRSAGSVGVRLDHDDDGAATFDWRGGRLGPHDQR